MKAIGQKSRSGFTLIELMIVIAIIGILAAVAVPQYGSYIKRSKFVDIATRANTVKLSVEVCIQHLNTPDDCDGGENGVTDDFTGSGTIESIETVGGKITATGSSVVDNRTYVLNPTYTPATNSLLWQVQGTCVAAGYC